MSAMLTKQQKAAKRAKAQKAAELRELKKQVQKRAQKQERIMADPEMRAEISRRSMAIQGAELKAYPKRLDHYCVD